MYSQRQITLTDRAVTEAERQVSIIGELEEAWRRSRNVPAFEATPAITEAYAAHAATLGEVSRVCHAAVMEPVIADHAFTRNAAAFDRVLEAFFDAGLGNGSAESDFARLVEQKKQEHAAAAKPTEEPAPEAKPTEDAGTPQEPPAAEKGQEPPPAVPQTEAPETEPTAPEAKPTGEEEEEPKADANTPCETVQHATGGTCQTVSDALKTCQESGMRVEHAHAATETEPAAPEAKPTGEPAAKPEAREH